MVRRSSSKKRSAPNSFKRKRSTSRKTRTKRRSGNLGDIHSFKGIVNAGILSGIQSSTSTHLGGQYIFKLSDLPIVGTGGSGLGESFDFVRLNKCKMEFMPRYNMSTEPNTAAGGTASQSITFLTGLDEIPITTTAAVLTPAPTWSAQGGDDSAVTETTAYDHVRMTADYVRGMTSGKETEIYKKHVVHFSPVFYDYVVNSFPVADVIPTAGLGIFQRRSKQWVNLNNLSQNTNSEVQSLGPDYYGPCYAFSNNVAGSSNVGYYDVKLHYSVSFRRLRGI